MPKMRNFDGGKIEEGFVPCYFSDPFPISFSLRKPVRVCYSVPARARRLCRQDKSIRRRQVAEDFEVTGLPVDVDLRLTFDFPLDAQVQMIRIVQEALTNIRKYAQAGRVRLTAQQAESWLVNPWG